MKNSIFTHFHSKFSKRVLTKLIYFKTPYTLDTNEVIGPDPKLYKGRRTVLSAVVEDITKDLSGENLVYDPQRGSYAMEQPR